MAEHKFLDLAGLTTFFNNLMEQIVNLVSSLQTAINGKAETDHTHRVLNNSLQVKGKLTTTGALEMSKGSFISFGTKEDGTAQQQLGVYSNGGVYLTGLAGRDMVVDNSASLRLWGKTGYIVFDPTDPTTASRNYYAPNNKFLIACRNDAILYYGKDNNQMIVDNGSVVDYKGYVRFTNGRENSRAVFTGTIEDREGNELLASNFAPANHTHTGTDHTHDITTLGSFDAFSADMQSQINGKAPATHTHQIADVEDLEAVLADKADSNHTHSFSDLSFLSTLLQELTFKTHSYTISKAVSQFTTSAMIDVCTLPCVPQVNLALAYSVDFSVGGEVCRQSQVIACTMIKKLVHMRGSEQIAELYSSSFGFPAQASKISVVKSGTLTSYQDGDSLKVYIGFVQISGQYFVQSANAIIQYTLQFVAQ